MYNIFENGKIFIGETKKGVLTGDNERFLRLWYEVDLEKIGFGIENYDEMILSHFKWFPVTSGGIKRKWYGNFDTIVNLENGGQEIRNNVKNYRLRDIQYYFLEAITWTEVSSGILSCRYVPKGILFGNGGPVSFFFNGGLKFCLGLLNSKVVMEIMSYLAPTINYGPEQIDKIPVVMEMQKDIERQVEENISISKNDWDSFETSWDFQQHPLVRCASFSRQEMESDAKEHIQDMNYIEDTFTQLKSNEEELNHIFIDIYDLQDELTPEVEDKDVTVRKADLQCDIKSLISYAVGCMFGRYSLDKEGLIFAGGRMEDKFSYYGGTFADTQDYQLDGKYTLGELGSKFYYMPIEGKKALECWKVDADNIIPITDDEYFEDDIVEKFITFIRTVYGKQTLEENLKFIADALGGKGQPREVIRNYFLNDFYKDHCKIYQKRPIYWLFDSGKKNGFKCLIYMHRYEPDTIARIRTDYVHEQQSRYRTAIADLEHRIANAGTSERVKLNKSLKKIQEQADELHTYEEKIHHLADQMIAIDLDDGVKHNYEIFKDVLAKIK